MFMVMFVLDDYGKLDEILAGWKEKGFTGTTLIESTGCHRQSLKNIPMRYSYGAQNLLERGNITLMSVVDSEDKINAGLEVVEKIVGDLDNENTGIYCAWPLILSKGIR